MNDKEIVVVYPRDIKFIDESGTISYYVDRKVSDYVKELQDKLSKIENENRQKDIDNLQLQSNWNSLREFIEKFNFVGEFGTNRTYIPSDVVLDKMNELEKSDIIER